MNEKLYDLTQNNPIVRASFAEAAWDTNRGCRLAVVALARRVDELEAEKLKAVQNDPRPAVRVSVVNEDVFEAVVERVVSTALDRFWQSEPPPAFTGPSSWPNFPDGACPPPPEFKVDEETKRRFIKFWLPNDYRHPLESEPTQKGPFWLPNDYRHPLESEPTQKGPVESFAEHFRK